MINKFTIYFVMCSFILQASAKFVTLTPSNPSQQGATISTTDEVTTSHKWFVNSDSTDSWNIVTQLDDSWGFHPENVSTITFEIDSPTAAGYDTFYNLLFAFSVPNIDKYIALRSNLYPIGSNDELTNRIVPQTDGICPQLADFTPMVQGDVVTELTALSFWNFRSGKLDLTSFDSNDVLNEIRSGSQSFPLQITLENYPDEKLVFTYESVTGHLTQQCIYEPFDTNQGLTIYFAVDGEYGEILIDSISITSSVSTTSSISHLPSSTLSSSTVAPRTSTTVTESTDSTAECRPNVTTTASWSSSYLSISIHMKNNDDMVQIISAAKKMSCDQIFADVTNVLIGDDAVCSVHKNAVGIFWIIDLSSTSVIHLNDSLVVKRTAVECLSIDDANMGPLSSEVVISSISEPSEPNTPNIVISKQSGTIGVCDDMTLDARSTTNLGGRDDALFEWQVSIQGDETIYVGRYIVIESDALVKGGTYSIILTVTNWYGATSSTTLDVFVSSKVIPVVSVHGITNYTSTNLNLNGMLDMFTYITFDESCLTNQENHELQYDIVWSVQHKLMDEHIVQHETSLKLQKFLQQQVSEDISVDAVTLLQPCSVYIFNANVKCNGYYECDVNAKHEVTYECAPIQCKISTEDIMLNDVDPLVDLDFAVTLDGDTFTYDPDATLSQNTLQWSWNCVDLNHPSESCAYLLDSIDSAIVHLDLSLMEFDYDASYLFGIEMIVFDDYNLNRKRCEDLFVLEINTIEYNSTLDVIAPFVVTVTSIASEMNRNERLRLIGNIANYPVNALEDEEGEMHYEWSELNDLLTPKDIAKYRQTSDDNSLNLILEENVLISGETYLFVLEITQYDAMRNMIGFGASEPLSVYILKEPKIVSGSFQIEPQCNKTYESIRELLSTSHSLSLYADGDHVPLLYVFGYKYGDDVHYLNPLILYDSFVSDIYLPVGTFSVFVDVIDTKSTRVSEAIPCSISLRSYSVCIDFEAEIITPFVDDAPLFTLSETCSFILQQSMHYMRYLVSYEAGGEDDDARCAEQSLEDIVGVMHQTALDLSGADALCQYNSPVVLLSEAVTLWMDVIKDLNLMHLPMFLLSEWTQILMHTLDPCGYLMNDAFDVKALYVSNQSIITKIAKIYEGSTDVTNQLSTIITNPNYHHLLYALASTVIDFIKLVTLPSEQRIVLNNLLSDSLYISELIRISLSIPSESTFTQFTDFSIYSARANNQNIHVSLHDIDVFIPDTVTTSDSGDIFSSVDVLVIGIDSSSNTVSTSSGSSQCDNNIATLSNNSVSVTLSGNRSAHLVSNINFTFACGEGQSCDSFDCVWYNKQTDAWQNDGCDTRYDEDTIYCSCSHLTTFATIHNIHSSSACDDNKYVDEWLTSWNGAHICMALIFLLIFSWTVVDLHPFYRLILDKTVTWKYHRAVYGVLMISASAFFQITVQIQACITRMAILKEANNAAIAIKIYTLLMLLPQVTLFMLFTSIFYSWFVLSHGFLKNLEQVQRRLSYLLLGVNIFIWCFLIVYYVLICAEFDAILMIAAYIWSAMLSIAAIFMTIYSVLVGKVLYTAAKISQDQYFGQNDWKVVKRLLTSNAFLTLYFIFEAVTTIYLAVDPHHQTVIYSTLYSCMDAICLVVIFWMYRTSLQNLKLKLQLGSSRSSQFTRCKSDTATQQAASAKSRAFTRMRTTTTESDIRKKRVATPQTPMSPINPMTPSSLEMQMSKTSNEMPSGKTEIVLRTVSVESYSHESQSCAHSEMRNQFAVPMTMTQRSADPMDVNDASDS